MKVSKALEGILLNRIHGADVPDVFKNMCLGDYQALMSWIIEIETAQSQTVEIDMRHAPQWFVELVRGNRIASIKEIRASIQATIHAGDSGDKCANLYSSKNFVEAMSECIIAPSHPPMTSA